MIKTAENIVIALMALVVLVFVYNILMWIKL